MECFKIEWDESNSVRNIEFNGKWPEDEISWLKQSLAAACMDLLIEITINSSPSFRWSIVDHSSLKPLDFVIFVQAEKINGKAITMVTGIKIPDARIESKASFISKENKFSKRELEILNHLVRGQTNKEIAKELYISEYTVDGHRSKIYKKLGVHSFKELVKKMG